MSGVYRFISLCGGVLLFLVGAGNLALALAERYGGGRWSWPREFLALTPPLAETAWWALLAAVPLSLLLLRLEHAFSRDMLVLKGEAGQDLKIREEAVSRYLREDLLLLPFVRTVKVQTRGTGGVLSVKAQVWVTSAGPLDHLQERILQRLRGAATAGLGIAGVADIDLRFESVQLSRAERKHRRQDVRAGDSEAGEDGMQALGLGPAAAMPQLQQTEPSRREE